MLPCLNTPRLVLRPAGDGDVDGLCQMLGLPEVRRYLCDDKVLPREVVAGFVAENERLAPRGMGLWVVTHDGRPAGLASLKPVPQVLVDLVPHLEGEVEPTVALEPSLWGKGLASEMLGAVLAHGFATLGLPRIAAVCDVPNVASARMLNRAGFRRTGEHPGVFYRVVTWTLER